MQMLSRLPSAGVPDRARRLVIPAFAPDCVRRAVAVDGETEVVSEGKAETFRQNLVVTLNRPGEPGFGVPGSAAVG